MLHTQAKNEVLLNIEYAEHDVRHGEQTFTHSQPLENFWGTPSMECITLQYNKPSTTGDMMEELNHRQMIVVLSVLSSELAVLHD